MFGFTAFEVHDEVVSLLLRSFPDVSFEGGIKHSFELELVDNMSPEILEDNVWKSPTRPDVAGEEVVLVGEFEHVVVRLKVVELFSVLWGNVFSTTQEVVPVLVNIVGTLSADLLMDELLLSLESVGSGNSSK